MKGVLVVAGLLAATQIAGAAESAHWGYEGSEGPSHWAELNPAFATCGSGKNQSPINLTHFIESELGPLGFRYQAGGNEILNNGHTIQINYVPGSVLTVDGHDYELKQFHFHSPSENQIEGKSYPLEAHLVHADASGNLAVVAVMFDEGAKNTALAKAWAKLPQQAGQKSAADATVEDLLPEVRDYYRYNGSLTTPPCTEGVTWLVMKNPVTASAEQIERFAHVIHQPNNRPLQPVNARPVLK